jgi:hypothetical protein
MILGHVLLDMVVKRTLRTTHRRFLVEPISGSGWNNTSRRCWRSLCDDHSEQYSGPTKGPSQVLNLQQIGTDGRLFQGDLMDEVIVEMIVMAMPNIMTTMPNSGTHRPDV